MEKMKKEIALDVASRIKFARKEMGYTQELLAEKAEISTRHIHNLEAGTHMPGLHVLERICTALHVSPAHILTGEKDEFYKIKSMLELLDESQRFIIEEIIKIYIKQNIA